MKGYDHGQFGQHQWAAISFRGPLDALSSDLGPVVIEWPALGFP